MKTAMIFGTFDILHYGHLHLFRQAGRHGDRVVAVVARDVNVRKVKGCEPFHDERERLEFLRHMDLIDKAVLGDMNDVYKIVRRVKPDVICLGYDQRVFVDDLKKMIDDFGFASRIIRLKPYKSERYKTSKMKEYLNKII